MPLPERPIEVSADAREESGSDSGEVVQTHHGQAAKGQVPNVLFPNGPLRRTEQP